MSQEYIEISEKTVSEAITAACQKLGVPSERLEYEVIDQGKTGFLGIGARMARIRARVRQGMEDSAEFDTSALISNVLKGKDTEKNLSDPKNKEAAKEEKKEERKADRKKEDGGLKKDPEKRSDEGRAEKKPEKKSEKSFEKSFEKKLEKKTEKKSEKKPERKPERKTEKELTDPAVDVSNTADFSESGEEAFAGRNKKGSARRESFERNPERGYRERGRGHRRQRRFEKDDSYTGFSGQEETRQPAEPMTAPRKKSTVPVLTDAQIEEIKNRADTFLMDVFHAMDLDAEVKSTYDRETGMLTLDMEGENMGILIGKRGQTLDSLQYLVSLVVNKGIDGYVHVKADTENYRERRKKTLENLAKNIAAKVKRNHTSVALEPMNPYERRIIHSALQGDRYVTTCSEGEEPYRKVIVKMKEDRTARYGG